MLARELHAEMSTYSAARATEAIAMATATKLNCILIVGLLLLCVLGEAIGSVGRLIVVVEVERSKIK